MSLSLRSDISPSTVRALASETNIAQFIQVAAVTALAYDTIITMDREVKYFWKEPRRSIKFVYFTNRYVGLSGAVAFLFWDAYGMSLAICKFADWSRSIANYITILLIDYILTIRVLALYSKDRPLSICLNILLSLEAIILFGLFLYFSLSFEVTVVILVKDVTLCGIAGNSLWQLGILDWVIPLSYAVILLVLAIYKATEYWMMSTRFRGFVLVKILVQDQILYFTLVLANSTVNLIQFKIPVTSLTLKVPLQVLGNPSFLCVLGSRMLVNLKEAGHLGLNEGTNIRLASASVSEMEFTDVNDEVLDHNV